MTSRNCCFTIFSDDHPSTAQEIAVSNENFYWDILPEYLIEDYMSTLGSDQEPTQNELDQLANDYLESSPIKYIVYQREVCPKTGRHHYQGYMELKKSVTWASMKKILGCPWAHVEKRHDNYSDGTPISKSLQQKYASDYGKKADTRVAGEEPFEWGELARQGARTDLSDKKSETYRQAIDDIVTRKIKCKRDFVLKHPQIYAHGHAGIDKLFSHCQVPRSVKTKVVIHWGDSECGKSTMALNNYTSSVDGERKQVYMKTDDPAWWDGYEGQEIVIIDEYDESDLSFKVFKKVADKFEYRVPVKGGYVQLVPEIIIFTSNVDPCQWYPDDLVTSRDIKAFTRRIDEVWCFSDTKKDAAGICTPFDDTKAFHDVEQFKARRQLDPEDSVKYACNPVVLDGTPILKSQMPEVTIGDNINRKKFSNILNGSYKERVAHLSDGHDIRYFDRDSNIEVEEPPSPSEFELDDD